jgi:hypothetical protein
MIGEIYIKIIALEKIRTHKSALEIYILLDNNKDAALADFAKSDVFQHYFTQLEFLVYNDANKLSGDYFEIKYEKIISNIVFHLKKALPNN